VKRPTVLVLFPLLLTTVALAQGPSIKIEPGKIVKQTKDLRFTCGPASILNCLAFGRRSFQSIYGRIPGHLASEKLSYVISKYGSEDSIVKPGNRRFAEDVGMYNEDILATVNALLSDYDARPLDGICADRLSGETSFDYLRRVHQHLSQSLSKKVPVVASVESYAAYEYKDYPGLKWRGGFSHTILITGVPRGLAQYEKGFTFEFVDSLNGTIEQGYVYTEEAREFQAVRRNGANFEWISGSPFLLVILPSLSLGTEGEAWNVRTIMTLSYLIGAFKK
jgi:hypothetical protein